jgi:hypothetical protein
LFRTSIVARVLGNAWVVLSSNKDCLNVPEPPKNAKREYYLRLEKEQKECNNIAHQRRNDL